MNSQEMKSTKVSIVVSTYNRPDALKVCIRSIFKQTRLPDEIIIGDDGSGQTTLETVQELQKESIVPIVHVWHEDNGFRLAMMRNKSIAAATGDYIIEVDGDVYLHPKFVEDHLSMASPGYYLKGGRTNLGQKLTESICANGYPKAINCFTKGIEGKSENSIRIMPIAKCMALRYRRHKSHALGCNMSFYREDFMRINGYDEFFEGWGGEDLDLGNRMLRSGVKKKYLKFCGIVYHLWHEDKFMYNKAKNFAHMLGVESEVPVYCDNGIDKYL